MSRGYVEIRNGPVVCKIDIDRPLNKEEMEALGPLAAAIDTVRRVIEADEDDSEPSPALPDSGACGDPACLVLHDDSANPIHPPWYVDSRTVDPDNARGAGQ